MKKKIEQCGNCKYFLVQRGKSEGICRFLPYDHKKTVRTMQSQWCGQWQPGPDRTLEDAIERQEHDPKYMPTAKKKLFAEF